MKSLSSGMEIGIVAVVLVVGALVAVSNFVVPPRRDSPFRKQNVCTANLKQIEGAIEMYALENKLAATNRITFADISGGTNKMIRSLINVDLICPAGGTYSITTVGKPPRCSVPGHSIDPPPE
jgi:hypothetical protein